MSESLQRPTRHYYAWTEEVDQLDDFDRDGRWQQSFVFIFRCAKSGAARQYGIESTRLRAKVLP